ncbi:unnamed protein product [Arabidopsis halleri]
MLRISKYKTLSTLFCFASKYRTNAGISLRTAEIFRSLHTPEIFRPDSTYGSDIRQNQALETLRKLGVEFSEENCKAFVTKKIDIAIQCGGGRAQIMSAFKFLKEEGLSIEEGMYSSCLCYLIDEKMEKKFNFLIRILKEEIPDSLPVLGYYEMLLWIELNDVQKIEEIGCGIIDRWGKLSSLEVHYLEALCVANEDEFLKTLLKTVDITKASSLEELAPIFEYLGRSESLVEAIRLLGKLKTTLPPEHISLLIFWYATSIEYDWEEHGRNGAIETCKMLHSELSIKPSLELFEKLIAFECYSENYSKVPSAAKIVSEMSLYGLVEDTAEGEYFYNTIERIYGADWLGTTGAVISDMGSGHFKLDKFLDMFHESSNFFQDMPRSLITTFCSLAVRSTGKASNTATRNVRVSIVRALNTRAISELDTFSEISQQKSPEYASKTSAYASLRSALETGAETSSQALYTLESLGFIDLLEKCETAILLNIQNAKSSNNEENAIEQMAKAFELMVAMERVGFCVEERIYGPLLKFLIDMKMIDMIFDMIRDGQRISNSSPEFARLGYYEMLLWIQLKDEEKINEILASIFEYLGRSISESVAKKLLRELNKKGIFWFRSKKVSELIFSYVTSIPNMWVGSAVFKFNELLEELKVSPSSASYQKLIKYSCDLREEETGLWILEHMYEVGLEVSSDTAVYLFRTIEQNYEFDMLRAVQNVLRRMSKEKDESRMFNLRLAIYIWEVLFGRCEPNHKEGGHYKPWLKDNYNSFTLEDYENRFPCTIEREDYGGYGYDYETGEEEEYYCRDDDSVNSVSGS